MTTQIQEVPVDVVGSSTFGIYPKISLAKTINMFISDSWMISYAGYRRLNSTIDGNEGRGLFHSIRGNFLLIVIDNKVYKVNKNLGATLVGTINTRFGEVFIDENLNAQICIVDGNDAWIYEYSSNTFAAQKMNVGSFDVIPGYVTYHNSFFLIAPSPNDPNNTNNWYAFQFNPTPTDPNNNDLITLVSGSVFPLQTKPDKCLAVKRLPSKSNHVLVIGSSVCEVFTNIGGEQNYRRASSFNIDSGCVSKSTIAANEQFLCFLSQNENNAPVILMTDGTQTQPISDDGINHLLQTIEQPEKSTAFFYRQNGHLFYQITFFAPEDNLTLFYDFKTKKFYHATDDKLNYHPARQVAYFNERVVFVGLERGSLYEWSTDIDGVIDEVGAVSGNTLPQIRITSPFRLPNAEPFVVNDFTLWIEQGVDSYPKLLEDGEFCFEFMITEDTSETMITEGGDTMLTEDGYCIAEISKPRVDLGLSKSGGQTFSNEVGRDMNPTAFFQNKMEWRQIGYTNEISYKLTFSGLNRFVVNNAIARIEK